MKVSDTKKINFFFSSGKRAFSPIIDSRLLKTYPITWEYILSEEEGNRKIGISVTLWFEFGIPNYQSKKYFKLVSKKERYGDRWTNVSPVAMEDGTVMCLLMKEEK